MSSRHQLCTFFVDDLHFGIDVLDVQEVLRRHPMTRVPGADPVIGGLINLRGNIVTALDLRRRLRLEPSSRPPRMNVVIRRREDTVALLVDEIGDVLDAHRGRLEAPPRTLIGTVRELVRGVYKLPDTLLLLLDTDRTLSLGDAGAGLKSTEDRPMRHV